MSKLPVLRPREVISTLKRAGFYEDHRKGSHVAMRNDDKHCSAVVAVHPGTVPKGTLKSIIRQAKMTVEEFCSFSK